MYSTSEKSATVNTHRLAWLTAALCNNSAHILPVAIGCMPCNVRGLIKIIDAWKRHPARATTLTINMEGLIIVTDTCARKLTMMSKRYVKIYKVGTLIAIKNSITASLFTVGIECAGGYPWTLAKVVL